jgi:hypothetical protein
MSMVQDEEIQKELKACREAWAAHPEATMGWCIHHEIEIEALEEPIKNRISFISTNKAPREQALRFRNMRPVISALPPTINKARAEWDKARAELDKARVEWDKARAELDKARVEWDKARAEWGPEERAKAHLADVPNHTWNGRSIF